MDSTEKQLFQNLNGFFFSKIMFTASELGIFDLLMESGELLTSEAIAKRLGTSHMGMEKLLEACVGLNLLRMEKKDNKGLYGNTKLANLYLAKSSPKSQYYYMQLQSEVFYPSLQYLADAVREGKSQIKSIYGPSAKNYFDALYSSEEGMQKYFWALENTWNMIGREVMSAFDLSNFHLICDLGGSTGTLAKECTSLYPNSTVIIFDLPEVVERSKKHSVAPAGGKILFQEGDFLKDPVPEADLYIVARVLHLWDDEKSVQLLTKLHKACKPGGGVLVIESILNDDRSGPLEAHVTSLKILLNTDGKIRTPSEHSELFSASGFKKVEVKKGSLYGIILGRK
ncbi:acetylserotonin O-methyltransferase-like [Sceloporus undulatus]|uniref:acetylserotonin O-methyltransferase-like n=1 Tax=Sceloporus undulatus TaxID=8520 RepID=UPI001C4BDC85|nr:acetylserotonin O-methyltransferase-like [Sceloporus undulatus]